MCLLYMAGMCVSDKGFIKGGGGGGEQREMEVCKTQGSVD
jgi:hypothetical protein